MSGEHQPNAEFVNQLEWQIRTSLRREDRFSSPVSSNRRDKMKMIAFLVISAFFGAGAAVATDGVQESRAQEILLTRIEGQKKIAEIQLQMALSNREVVQRQADAGLITEEAVLGAGVTVREAESQVAQLQLDEEEVRISGEAPQNAISAPLVGGRDFMLERLRLQQWVTQEHFVLVQNQAERIISLVEAGLVREIEESETLLALERVQQELLVFENRMTLRERYTGGGLTAGEAEIEQRIMEAESQLAQEEMVYENLRQHAQDVRVRVEAGVMQESELDQLRYQMEQLSIEMEMVQQTMALLRNTRGGDADNQ